MYFRKRLFTKWISGNLKGRPSTPTKGFFKRPQLGKGLIDCKAHSMIWCEPAASLSSSQFSEVKPRLNLSWGQIQGCALSLFDFWGFKSLQQLGAVANNRLQSLKPGFEGIQPIFVLVVFLL